MSMKDLNKLMKQAQKMQSAVMEQQSKLASLSYEATAGGMVTVKVSGKLEVIAVAISKDCIDPSDPEMLQDLVKVAVNEALKKARDDAEQSMGAITGGMGLNLPGF